MPSPFSAGQVNCSSCKRCHPDATTFGVCLAGSSSDVVNCTCNAGFYGSGLNCTRCKTCDTNAATDNTLTVGSCPTGDLPQGITCSCNAGYAGPGTQCSLCKQGTYSLAGSKQTVSLFKLSFRGRWHTFLLYATISSFGNI